MTRTLNIKISLQLGQRTEHLNMKFISMKARLQKHADNDRNPNKSQVNKCTSSALHRAFDILLVQSYVGFISGAHMWVEKYESI